MLLFAANVINLWVLAVTANQPSLQLTQTYNDDVSKAKVKTTLDIRLYNIFK